MTEEMKKKAGVFDRARGLWLGLAGGALAGVAFNLAFGAAPYSHEGILGGMISGALIHVLN